MKIRISKTNLLKGLLRVQNITSKVTTMPILSNILINSENGGITLFATDLQVGIFGTYECEIEKSGSVAIPCKRLYEIVKELPESDVLMELQDNYWVNIKCEKVKFKISGINPEEYPKFPDVKTESSVSVDAGLISDLIRKTVYAISTDEGRINIAGMLWSMDGENLELVATDGHRLAKVNTKVEGSSSKFRVTVPRKGIQEIRRLVEDSEGKASFIVSKNYVLMKKDEIVVIVRLIESDFPDYERVLVNNGKFNISVNRDILKQSVKRVSLMSNEKTRAIKLKAINKTIELSSNDPEIGEANEVIECDYKGEEISIGFNSKYLLDSIEAIDGDNVKMELNEPLSPCMLKGTEDKQYMGVIMPMRV